MLIILLLLPLGITALQVISSSTTVSLPVNTTTYLCININQTLALETVMYPVNDFGKLNVDIEPLYIPIVVVGNYSQFCGNVSESGTYYAILRTSSTTTTIELSTTTTVTEVPEVIVVDSGLSVIGWIGIIAGCLTVITIFLLLVCMATRSYKIVPTDRQIGERLLKKKRIKRRGH